MSTYVYINKYTYIYLYNYGGVWLYKCCFFFNKQKLFFNYCSVVYQALIVILHTIYKCLFVLNCTRYYNILIVIIMNQLSGVLGKYIYKTFQLHFLGKKWIT